MRQAPLFLVQLEDTPPRFIRKARNAVTDMEFKMTTRKIGRDARDGKFIPVKEAIRRPSTTVVETITSKPASNNKPTKPNRK